jgi:enterochelin esterase-like enzyme
MIRALALAGVLAVLLPAGASSSSASPIPGFTPSRYQGHDGTVWTGTIPGALAPLHPGPSYVYLPPHYSPAQHYPVVYLLHGLPGDPRIYVHGSHLAQVADRLIADGAEPFIAVAPYAGPATHRGLAEWAGRWEDYLVDEVVPWADATLPTIQSAGGRVLAGLSAGGFGAVDIGLRHPQLFGTLESWSGYFTPLDDGPFVHAPRAYLAAHDPTQLVLRETARLRRFDTRFELSTGPAHGRVTPSMTTAFAAELRTLGVPVSLWIVPSVHKGPSYGLQMARGLSYAFARAARP